MGRVPLLALLALLAGTATAEERIHRYHADIVVAADASVEVTETIAVRAEGDQIRRGIYRDLPTDYTDGLGNRVRIVPEVLEVRRNGAPAPYVVLRESNGIRIRIGSPDVFLDTGDHEYRIRYRVQRVLGHFDDHTELYWNVTGNGWGFAIGEASAAVTLPDGIDDDAIRVEAYTGRFGERGRAYRAEVDFQGLARFRTTRGLAPNEGLTIVVSWPPGHVAVPTLADDTRFLLSQNLGLLVALAGALGSLVYLFTAWRRTGVDPPPGVIFPHYEPPEGYSPASLRYVNEMGYDKRTFTAAVLNLAVKGFVRITEDDGDYTLERSDKSADDSLAPGEEALLAELFSQGRHTALENTNHAIVSGAMSAHKKALKRDYFKRYFVTNSLLLLPAAVLLVGTLVGIVVLELVSPLAIVVLVAGALVLALFAWLLKAPTAHGRRLMDRIAGFRMYLEVAEKDDLNLRNPPEKTPELFEAYLPYALALEVEQPWAEQFEDVLAAVRDEAGGGYQPRWYGGRWDVRNPVRMAGVVGGSLSSAISSAATPPGSSSGGGGGGSSGGGGGGGGGGGW